MQAKNVICPMTKFEHIKEILLLLLQRTREIGIKETGIKELSELTKKGKSVISNALPLLYELQLIERSGLHNDKINLTKSGMEMSIFLETNNNEKIRELATILIQTRSKILFEAYKILKEKPTTPSHDLGVNLHKILGVTQQWNERTYALVGRTCKYILDGFKLVPYEGGTVQRAKRKHRGRLKNKVIPSTSIDTILDIVDRYFDINDEWKVTNPQHSGSRQLSLLYHANSLIDLGIAEYIDHTKNIVKLTNMGKQLRQAINKNEREIVFQDILMQYPPLVDVLRMMMQMNKEVGYTEIGNILENYNNSHYSEITKKSYGMRLIGWLRMGNILEENSEWGKYHLSQSFLEKHKEIFSTIRKRIVTDTKTIQIKVVDIEKIIGALHRNCNRVYHSAKKEWYNDNVAKEKIISSIDVLADFYKSNDDIIRTLSHMRDWIITGYELKDKKNIKNCIESLIDKLD